MSPLKIFLFAACILFLVVFYNKKEQVRSIVFDRSENLPTTCIDTIVAIPDTIAKVEVSASESVSDSASFLECLGSDLCLSSYFEQLKNCSEKLTRIVYFGDSQIEGDHITYTLRTLLQQKYGGKGIGYMPVAMYFNSTEYVSVVTNDFEKEMVNLATDDSSCFGLYGSFSIPSKKECGVQIRTKRAMSNYLQFKMLYSGTSQIDWIANGEGKNSKTIHSDKISIDTLSFDKTPLRLKLKFTNHSDFLLHGFLLDPVRGIVVDHIPFRGSLHLMMSRFDQEAFCRMGDFLQPALVVLHFGVNVVPDVRSEYDNYRIALQHDIQLLKKYLPHASILVIGASDMARKENGIFTVYPNIDALVEVQRQAALHENVAFWDLRSAMGGKGAILDWEDRGWARTDYVHFTRKGAENIGALLYRDLESANRHYLHSNE